MGLVIQRPAANEAAAVVKPGTGPAFICARGTVGDERKKFTQLSVCAWIYRPNEAPAPFPPPGAPCVNVGGDGSWLINPVAFRQTITNPCANAPGPYPRFKLFAWPRDNGTVVTTAEQPSAAAAPQQSIVSRAAAPTSATAAATRPAGAAAAAWRWSWRRPRCSGRWPSPSSWAGRTRRSTASGC